MDAVGTSPLLDCQKGPFPKSAPVILSVAMKLSSACRACVLPFAAAWFDGLNQ